MQQTPDFQTLLFTQKDNLPLHNDHTIEII